MLEVEELHAGYGGGEVLAGVSFSLAAGEIAALLGRNGMGKTTLLRALMGQLKATRGRIRFGGADITHKETFEIARLGLAYVPQGREIFSTLTVEENLRLGALRGGSLGMAYDLFPALKGRARDPGGSLSGGQQQQLAIARALMTNPKLLLLDEPSEGIQPSIVQEIAGIVVEAARASGIAVLLVEQNTGLALKVAGRALFLETGRIAASFAAKDVTGAMLQQHMGV